MQNNCSETRRVNNGQKFHFEKRVLRQKLHTFDILKFTKIHGRSLNIHFECSNDPLWNSNEQFPGKNQYFRCSNLKFSSKLLFFGFKRVLVKNSRPWIIEIFKILSENSPFWSVNERFWAKNSNFQFKNSKFLLKLTLFGWNWYLSFFFKSKISQYISLLSLQDVPCMCNNC